MNMTQMELFYEKPTGYYKYWYRIYHYIYDTNRGLCRRISKPKQ